VAEDTVLITATHFFTYTIKFNEAFWALLRNIAALPHIEDIYPLCGDLQRIDRLSVCFQSLLHWSLQSQIPQKLCLLVWKSGYLNYFHILTAPVSTTLWPLIKLNWHNALSKPIAIVYIFATSRWANQMRFQDLTLPCSHLQLVFPRQSLVSDWIHWDPQGQSDLKKRILCTLEVYS